MSFVLFFTLSVPLAFFLILCLLFVNRDKYPPRIAFVLLYVACWSFVVLPLFTSIFIIVPVIISIIVVTLMGIA
jgi:hypothetical protein